MGKSTQRLYSLGNIQTTSKPIRHRQVYRKRRKDDWQAKLISLDLSDNPFCDDGKSNSAANTNASTADGEEAAEKPEDSTKEKEKPNVPNNKYKDLLFTLIPTLEALDGFNKNGEEV